MTHPPHDLNLSCWPRSEGCASCWHFRRTLGSKFPDQPE